jgi:hypothetical protein
MLGWDPLLLNVGVEHNIIHLVNPLDNLLVPQILEGLSYVVSGVVLELSRGWKNLLASVVENVLGVMENHRDCCRVSLELQSCEVCQRRRKEDTCVSKLVCNSALTSPLLT